MDLNINHVIENIKIIKYPTIFLYKLENYKEIFGDYNTNIILRIFFKYNIDYIINNNINKIFINIDKNLFPLTKKAIDDVYSLMRNKMIVIHIIRKWHDIYNNQEFWNKNSTEQFEYLEYMKHYFLGIFDMSKGGFNFIMRAESLLDDNNHNKNITLKEIKSRLVLVLNIFGHKIFNALNIPIITSDIFDDMDNKSIIIYVKLIFSNCINLLDQTLEIFNQYIMICNDFDNLFNPVVISINTLEITENYDDDIDVSLFC